VTMTAAEWAAWRHAAPEDEAIAESHVLDAVADLLADAGPHVSGPLAGLAESWERYKALSNRRDLG
jgi:hypothetical protein